MIESHAGGFTITGEHIPLYRLMVMRQGLEMELKGLRISRGRTCYAMAKAELGFKGNKAKVLEQLKSHIEAERERIGKDGDPFR